MRYIDIVQGTDPRIEHILQGEGTPADKVELLNDLIALHPELETEAEGYYETLFLAETQGEQTVAAK